MININGKSTEYTINLNNSKRKNYTVRVNSENENGTVIPWDVIYSSSECINHKCSELNKLSLNFDLTNITKDEFIVIKNTNNEKAKITVKPNIEECNEKTYNFDILNYEILAKNKIKFNVLSNVKTIVETKNVFWIVSYNGKPYNYKVTKKDDSIILELIDIVFSDIYSLFELEQSETKTKIKIKLKHHVKETMEVIGIEKS